MIAAVKTIIVELNGYRPASVDASQGDRGSRAVSCRLMENGAPWMIPEGATARVAYTLPNGTDGLYDRDADGRPMWQITGNTVTVELADQLMAQQGMVQMSVLIIGPEGEQLATWPIRVNVTSNRAARLAVPEGMPSYGDGFKGKIFYGGEDGTVTPLELGPGVKIRDGVLHVAGGGAGYVASDEPPEDVGALWVDTTPPEEAVALGATAVQTAVGVDIYATDELGTTKVSLRHGEDGEPGADGITPHIGDNGNWWVGDSDTGKPSRGEPGSGQNTTQKEVVTTVTVGSDPVVLDSTAPEQVIGLAWTVKPGRTIPAFTNYYRAKGSASKVDVAYPRAFDTTQYVQFFSPSYHGDEAAFVAGHLYFHAMKYRMDGDSTATLQNGTFLTPTGSKTISGSGWVYGVGNPTAANSTSFIFNKTNTGTGVVEYVYCIDITARNEAGVTTPTTLAELAALFGELPLVPGEDYPGGTVGGTAALSINRGGEINTVDNSSSTATVKGGDILSVEGGSVTFMLKILKTVDAGDSDIWEGIKWVAFGDSLTDGSINADTKYHKLIAEKTGITVVDMGKGGTGYWRRNDEGNAFYQRMANVPADADVITTFGSVNDWMTVNSGVAYGEATDTIEAGTLAGYINECIDVAIEKAPYAQIALITPLDYHGIPDYVMEAIANIIVEVARARKIKCLDLYHESGFRVDDPVFAQAYCTDYSATADVYGHPSNLAHEKIIAPEFMELLRRMIF